MPRGMPEFGDVPIIGEATVGDWMFAYLLTCPCGHTGMMLGVIGMPKPCGGKNCKRVYMMARWPTMDDRGRLIFSIQWRHMELPKENGNHDQRTNE